MLPAGKCLAQNLGGIGMDDDPPRSASFCNGEQGLNRADFTLTPYQRNNLSWWSQQLLEKFQPDPAQLINRPFGHLPAAHGQQTRSPGDGRVFDARP